MRAMSTAALPIRSIERDHLEHRGHRLGLLRVAGRQHRHGAHVVDEVGHLVLELVDLLGHVGVAEVEGGVGEVDHQLREILGFGEHRSEVAGFGIHRVPRGYDASARGGTGGAVAWSTLCAVRRRPALSLALAGLLAAVVMACSEADGRTLPPADPNRTTTTPSAPVIQPPTGDVDVFTLGSAAFGDGGVIPDRLTCTGTAVSPDLSWTGAPLDTAELAIVVRDRDAGGFVHWIVTGIDPFVQAIGEDGIPENAVEGPNGAGAVGWLAPCPPAGSGTHTYEVALLALPGAVAIPPDDRQRRGGRAPRSVGQRASHPHRHGHRRVTLPTSAVENARIPNEIDHRRQRITASWRLSASRRPSGDQTSQASSR